jgi:hypothetical protein
MATRSGGNAFMARSSTPLPALVRGDAGQRRLTHTRSPPWFRRKLLPTTLSIARGTQPQASPFKRPRLVIDLAPP